MSLLFQLNLDYCITPWGHAAHKYINLHQMLQNRLARVVGMGSSSVLFAYLFLLLFGQIGNIYKVEQDSLYFFLEGAFKGIYLRERNFTLSYVVSEI